MRVELKNAGIYTDLCEEGSRLREDWMEAMDLHAAPEVVYARMRDYFLHRNGIATKNYSKRELMYCDKCSCWKPIPRKD